MISKSIISAVIASLFFTSTPSQAFAASTLELISITTLEQTSYIVAESDTGRYSANLAYRVNDKDSLRSAIANASDIADALIQNSFPLGFYKESRLITPINQDNDFYILVETTLVEKITLDQQDKYLDILKQLNDELNQAQIVTARLANTYKF